MPKSEIVDIIFNEHVLLVFTGEAEMGEDVIVLSYDRNFLHNWLKAETFVCMRQRIYRHADDEVNTTGDICRTVKGYCAQQLRFVFGRRQETLSRVTSRDGAVDSRTYPLLLVRLLNAEVY